MINNSISQLSNVSSYAASQTQSSDTFQKVQQNPEFFPLLMAKMMNTNINTLLFTATNPGEDVSSSSESNNIFGLPANYGADPLSMANSDLGSVYNSTSADPLGSLFGSQGIGSDYFNPLTSLKSYQIYETLQSLTDYSNLKESQSWYGQKAVYIDPADGTEKIGIVSEIEIENVAEPIFVIDGKKVTQKSLIKLV